MNAVAILNTAVYLVVYVVALLLALAWPRGRAKNVLVGAILLWTTNAALSVAINIVLMNGPGRFPPSVQVMAATGRICSLAAAACFLAFVLIMRHELHDLRYRAEDAEARASLEDG